MARRRNKDAPIIIKKGKKHKHDFHGGNWKVAMADFMTSMFILFLVLWLLNITTAEQKQGIADFFSPASVSQEPSGSGGVLSGQSIIDGPFAQPGGPPLIILQTAAEDPTIPLDEILEEAESLGLSEDDLESLEAIRGEVLYLRIQQLIADALAANAGQNPAESDRPFDPRALLVQQTEEGIKITLRDLEGQPMFASGSPNPLPRTVEVLRELMPILMSQEGKIKITGHTDGVPFSNGPAGYSNWELSADRANATRRTLVLAGLDPTKIDRVEGQAETQPFNLADPLAAENRRIEITVMNPRGLLTDAGRQLPVDALNGTSAPAPVETAPTEDAAPRQPIQAPTRIIQ